MIFSPSRGLRLLLPAAAFGVWGAAAGRQLGAATLLGEAAVFRRRVRGDVGRLRHAPIVDRRAIPSANSYFAVVCMVLALFAAELEEPIRKSGTRCAKGAWDVDVHVLRPASRRGEARAFQWPGYRMTLEQQTATVWDITMFPLLHMFVDGGPIAATPSSPGESSTAWR